MERCTVIFTEVNPIGVIGSYLLDKFDNEENPFRFKHHYIFNALESEVLYDLLDIMNGNCNAEIKLFSNNMQKIKTYKVLPLKILCQYILRQTVCFGVELYF